MPGCHVDGDDARGLRHVYGEEHVLLTADRTDGRGVLDGPQDVGAMVDDHQSGVGLDGAGYVLGIDEAVAVEGNEVVGDDPVLLHDVERPQHRVVFEGGRHHVVARPADTLDDHVERRRRIQAEADPVGVGGGVVEETVEKLARALDHGTRLGGQGVLGAAGAHAASAVEIRHGVDDIGRLGEGGGSVVQIDQVAHVVSSAGHRNQADGRRESGP